MDVDYFEEKTYGIKQKIREFSHNDLKLFVSSSFQTHSIPLLHILSRIEPEIPVYFINTGYHFPETLVFRDRIAALLNLKVNDTKPAASKNMQCDDEGNLYFASDPDYCCYLNKIQPLEPVLIEKDVWINGIRGDQNANRNRLRPIEKGPFQTLRYHPMLNWSHQEIGFYRRLYRLPPHPLEEKGYFSIGCEPCTRKPNPKDASRQGRWFGLKKTECGLHTDLITRK